MRQTYLSLLLPTLVSLLIFSSCSNNRTPDSVVVPSDSSVSATTTSALDSSSPVVNRPDPSLTKKMDDIPNTPVAHKGIAIFQNGGGLTGFGYDILVDGKVYVHQPNIPAVPGNRGFATEAAAMKTARFVLNKINSGIMPPSIDVKELDSLGVLK